MTTAYYTAPTGRFTLVFNRSVRWLSDHRIGLAGARTLTVVGRVSGTPQAIAVNPLVIDGRTYLISPRGNSHWSRNLRAAGTCQISRGRQEQRFDAVEVADEAKIDLLRPYLKRWGWQVANYLPTKVSHTSTDAELAAVAPDVPIFELRVPSRRPIGDARAADRRGGSRRHRAAGDGDDIDLGARRVGLLECEIHRSHANRPVDTAAPHARSDRRVRGGVPRGRVRPPGLLDGGWSGTGALTPVRSSFVRWSAVTPGRRRSPTVCSPRVGSSRSRWEWPRSDGSRR